MRSQILNENIQVYRTAPSRLQEDAENERAIVDDYQGRAILELLQNADDAQFSSDHPPTKKIGDHFVEFELNEAYFIVRNGGYPISPEGIKSLAGMRISPKDKKVMIGNKGIGFKSVLELTDQPIIKSYPFHFNFSEEETAKILRKENLLRNLEKTKYCPILRLPFELSSDQKWDGNGTWATEIILPLRDQKAFDKSVEMLRRIRPEVLIFLQGLRSIRYKLGDTDICFSCYRENIIPEELKDGELIISEETETVSRYYRWVKTIPIPENIKSELPRNWQDLTHGQVAIAILLEDDGGIGKANNNKIHVYFPTEEFSPVNIIIHGNLRTDTSRKRILPEPYNKWVLSLTGLLLKEKVISKLQSEFSEDQGKILDCLEPRIPVEEMAPIEKEVWLSIYYNLKDYPFIQITDTDNRTCPQKILIPPEIVKDQVRTIFPQNYSIEGRYLPERSFMSSNKRINALVALGAAKLEPEKNIRALDNVAKPDAGWCTRALNLVLTIIQAHPRWVENKDYWRELVKICCSTGIFLCSDGNIRNADPKYPLFLPSKEKDDQLPLPPDFLNFAFLSGEVIEGLEENNKKAFEDLFVKSDETAIHSFNRKSILEKVIIPWFQNNRPSRDQIYELRKFLFDLMEIKEVYGDEPWNDKDGVRLVLCQLPVQLENGEEAPAWQVYAGKEWTGNDILEKLYGDRNDRFFLKAPEPKWDEKTKKRWEAFCKWLGVSWMPKVLPYHLPGEQKRDSTWNHDQNVFSLQGTEVSREDWTDYCHWLKEKEVKRAWNKDLFDRTPHMVDNRLLDGWERISKNIELGKIVLQLLTKELLKNNESAEVKYSSNLIEDYQNKTWEPPSFVVYMLKNFPWLPALDQQRKIAMHSAFDMFIPDSQLDRAFSEILPRLEIQGELPNRIEDFLKAIGVRSEFRELNEEDWKRWTTSIRERFPNPDKEEVERITSFYRKLLDEFPADGKWLSPPPLYEVEVLAFNGDQWGYHKPSECWYLDRPEHKELIQMLHDEWFFAVKLGKKGTKCKELFGLSPFSENLIAKPLPGIIDDGLTDELAMWFESRQPFLLARLSVERPKSKEKDMDYLKRIKMQCVESLRVRYHIKDREIGTRLEDAFLENLDDEQAILYLFSKIITLPFHECRDLILCFAKNLEYWLDAPYKDSFYRILSCKDEDLIKELEEAHVSSDLIEECKKQLESKRRIDRDRDKVKKREKMDDDGGTEEEKGLKEEEHLIQLEPVDEQNVPLITTSKPEDGSSYEFEIQPEYIGSFLDLVPEMSVGSSVSHVGEDREVVTEPERKETGGKGEDIFYNQLKRYPQYFGFSPDSQAVHKSKEDPNSIYDIEVINKEKGNFYLEVKSSGSGRPTLSFEMSERQWMFGEENQDRYQLWLVFDVWDDPKISGPHNPLELERQGKLKRTPKEKIVYSCKVRLPRQSH